MNLLFVAGFQILIAAQAGRATLSGVVRDQDTGQLLAGAVVALPELNRTIVTTDGRYAITAVPAGPQHIVVRSIGYSPRTLHALMPVSGILEINVSLARLPSAAQLPKVVVRHSIELRGLAPRGDTGSWVDKRETMAEVRNDPMRSQPDVFESLSGGEISVKPESPGGVNIRGGAAEHTSFVLDGIPVFNPYHTSGVFSAWNPDALASVSVASATRSFEYPSALSGTVSAQTRRPEDRITSRATVSNTNSGITLDGPLGWKGAGFLASVRAGYPHFSAPETDPNYVRGTTGDRLGKIGLPVFGGTLEILGYHAFNEIGTAAETGAERTPDLPIFRNTFEWQSQSVGGSWARLHGATKIELLGWSSAGDAASDWKGADSPLKMAASRRDEGAMLSLTQRFPQSSLNMGARLERVRSSYLVTFDSAGLAPFQIASTGKPATVFARYATSADGPWAYDVGSSLISLGGELFANPQAELRANLSGRLQSSLSVSRTHQLVQSVRNEESVTSGIFPADLFIMAPSRGVPVARSDLAVLALTYSPDAAARLSLQTWARTFANIAMVAPFDVEPFATKPFAAGKGTSVGAALDAALTRPRFGLTGTYGIQRVNYSLGALEYSPDHGAVHVVDAGVIAFPSATFSLRAGIAFASGRRTTPVYGKFEWEGCNLRDRGCEFSGTPRANSGALGAQFLPPYMRVDVGARKHWHATIAGRDAMVSIFGTVTNVFNRKNVLTRALDPVTGALSTIEMRPRAPLVIGLEWQM